MTYARRPDVYIERVAAYDNFKAVRQPVNAGAVQLNCPPQILQAFQNLLRGTPILGATFINPYTGQPETFPADPNQLTARHLQILARNEQSNTNGIMNTVLYQGLLCSKNSLICLLNLKITLLM